MNGDLPGCIDMVISSKKFGSYEECATALTQLLSVLGTTEAQISNKNFVIVTKTNPLFSTTEAPKNDEEWDRLTIMRAYVADVDVLQTQQQLNYSIVGQLRISQESIDAIRNLNPEKLQ
jgi:hypothetical protein